MALEKPNANRPIEYLAVAAALVALIFSIYAVFRPTPAASEQRTESALARTKRTKILRVGYSGFQPYTIIDPNKEGAQRISGLAADMVGEIASRQTPPWTVEWHKVTFETLKGDMESGRFDVFADAVYQTAPRASEFGLTVPFGYFGVAVGLVRKNEIRFSKFEDLDRPDVTIALAEGWTSTEYARQHLKNAKFHLVAVADDPFVQLQEVIQGKADIALQDVPTIMQFARAHPAEVKTLWIDHPPTRVPAGFMTRQGEIELLGFLDASIRILEADGTMASLDRKWKALNEFPSDPLVKGTGLGQ